MPEYACGVNWHHLDYWYGYSQRASGEANEEGNVILALWMLDPRVLKEKLKKV